MTRIGWEQTAWNGIRSRRTNPTLLLHTLHVTRAHPPSHPKSARQRSIDTSWFAVPGGVRAISRSNGKAGQARDQAGMQYMRRQKQQEGKGQKGPDPTTRRRCMSKKAAVVHTCSRSAPPFALMFPPLISFLAHAVLRHSHDTGSGLSRRAVLDPEPGPPNGSGRGREREREHLRQTGMRADGWPHKRNQHFSVRVRGCTVSLTFLSGFAAFFFFSFLSILLDLTTRKWTRAFDRTLRGCDRQVGDTVFPASRLRVLLFYGPAVACRMLLQCRFWLSFSLL